MFLSLQNKSVEDINIVRLLISAHTDFAQSEAAESRNRIKVYAVSSCVTRLYAIYENFIETALSDYLDSLTELVRFSSLPDPLKIEYRMGVSYLLGKIDQGRYKHLSHENIVKWYYEALNDRENYNLVNAALVRHEQNLRLNIIDSLFSRIQLHNIRNWLSDHPEIKALYPDEGSIIEQFESELKDFVQFRNDASHGTIDSLEGEDNLNRLCEMLIAFVKAITSYLTKSLLSVMENNGKATHLGDVTESFEQNGAFITKVFEGTKISEGEILYFVSNNNCYSQEVGSMMLNDHPVTTVVAEADDYEVGIRCDDKVKKHSKIYKRA